MKPGAKPDPKAERRKGAVNYPPYVNAYGAIPKLFGAIRSASVPAKFSQDYLGSVLGLKSTSNRALIPLLKRLGFLNAANVPTAKYRAVRDEERGGRVLAEQLREAYADLYSANEYAHTLTKPELTSKLRSVLGAASDDPNVQAVVGTFSELVKLADFDAEGDTDEEPDDTPPRSRGRRRWAEGEDGDDETGDDDPGRGSRGRPGRSDARDGLTLGMSYTINLNLPATTDIQVFNAIFKALREHILGDR